MQQRSLFPRCILMSRVINFNISQFSVVTLSGTAWQQRHFPVLCPVNLLILSSHLIFCPLKLPVYITKVEITIFCAGRVVCPCGPSYPEAEAGGWLDPMR